MYLTFPFYLNCRKTFGNWLYFFKFMCGPWAVMWIFCWKHCLVGSIESFEFGYYSPSFFYISTISVLQQSNLKLSYNLLKIYFDQKEGTTLPDITEKIKLPIYFSQVTSLLKISLVLPVTNVVSEQSTITLRRIKNWLRTSMTQRKIISHLLSNHTCCHLLLVR